jgi:6-phosphogluconolactonase
MLRKALVLLLVLASMAACISCGSNSSHFVYATLPGANQIIVFREDPASGVLTQITGSPYSVGNGASSLVLHPSGKFLYVSNPGVNGQNENDISLFTIATDGALTEVFPRTTVAPNATLPTLLAMDPAGAFLYVANSGSKNISVFSIDASTGALTQVNGSPFFIGVVAHNMQLTPKGDSLYITAPSVNNGLIEGFSVNSGALTLVSITNADDPNPNGLAIDPSGTYLYVANYAPANSISIFAIGVPSPGALQEVSGSPLNAGYSAPFSLILDAKGQFLYVADQGSSNVAAFSISSTTGLPTALTTSTTTNAFVTEGSPSFLVTDPNGRYLFVGNQGSGAGIEVFDVSNGSLTAIATYAVGNTPTSIAVLGK